MSNLETTTCKTTDDCKTCNGRGSICKDVMLRGSQKAERMGNRQPCPNCPSTTEQEEAKAAKVFSVLPEEKEPEENLTPQQKELNKRIIEAFYQKEQDYEDGFKVGGEYLISTCGEPDEDHEDFIRSVREFVEKELASALKTARQEGREEIV